MTRFIDDHNHGTRGGFSATIKIFGIERAAKPYPACDLGLPDGLGYDLMRSLRARNHLRGIALSGYGMSEDIQLNQEAGFSEHLVKPVDLKKLQEAMARVLAGQK